MNSRKFFLIFYLIMPFGSANPVIKFEGKNATINLKTDSSSLILKDKIQNFSGRLKMPDDSPKRIQSTGAGNVIIFANGTIDTGSGDIAVTGTFSASGTTSQIQLGSGNQLDLTGKTVTRPITITAGQTAQLQGSPKLSAPITLGDSSTILQLGIVNKMDQNIALGGGTLQLTEDLRFKDTAAITGTGTVDINNRTLFRSGGSSQTGSVTFKNARDIQFADNQTLNGGTETYTGTGQSSLINGNGYTWNLLNAGKIVVDTDHKLYITDTRIKGLGPTASSSGYFTIDPTSTLVLANVTLDLSGNYAHNAGTILIEGDNCKIIHHDYTFNVTSANTRLRVDGVAFLFEPLTGSADSPFTFADSAQHLQTVNGGLIRSSLSSGSEASLSVSTTPYTLTSNMRLTGLSKLTFTNASPGTPKPMTLDGNGYYIQFPDAAIANIFKLETNVQLTLTNITLKDFNPAAMTYGASSSKIIFGNNVRVQLAKDIIITGSDRAFEFNLSSNSWLDGCNHKLNLNAASCLTVTGSGQLNIENTKVMTQNSGALSCLAFNSKINLKDSEFIFDQNNFTFSLGSIFIDGRSKISQANRATPGSYATFTFSSTGTLTISSQAELTLTPDTIFDYRANPAPGNETLVQSKRHFKFSDPSSTLILDASTLTTTNTGMAIDYGKVIVKNKSTLNISTATAANFELGSAVDLQIMGGGILDCTGPVAYSTTTYP